MNRRQRPISMLRAAESSEMAVPDVFVTTKRLSRIRWLVLVLTTAHGVRQRTLTSTSQSNESHQETDVAIPTMCVRLRHNGEGKNGEGKNETNLFAGSCLVAVYRLLLPRRQ